MSLWNLITSIVLLLTPSLSVCNNQVLYVSPSACVCLRETVCVVRDAKVKDVPAVDPGFLQFATNDPDDTVEDWLTSLGMFHVAETFSACGVRDMADVALLTEVRRACAQYCFFYIARRLKCHTSPPRCLLEVTGNFNCCAFLYYDWLRIDTVCSKLEMGRCLSGPHCIAHPLFIALSFRVCAQSHLEAMRLPPADIVVLVNAVAAQRALASAPYPGPLQPREPYKPPMFVFGTVSSSALSIHTRHRSYQTELLAASR